jgi:hypothetical protein
MRIPWPVVASFIGVAIYLTSQIFDSTDLALASIVVNMFAIGAIVRDFLR